MVYKELGVALRVHVNDDVRSGNVPSRFIITKKSSGDVVIGRTYVEEDGGYCSTMVDELMLWNRSLTEEEVEIIMSVYKHSCNDFSALCKTQFTLF